MATDIQAAARKRGGEPARAHLEDDHERRADAPWAGLHRPGLRRKRSFAERPSQPRIPVQPWPPRRDRVRLDPPGRPGHRALGRGELREEPDLLRSEEHRRTRDRGRLQRGRYDDGRTQHRLASLRPQDPLDREVEPQRAADLPDQVRPGDVRLGTTSGRPRRGRRRRDDLLRLRRGDPPDPRGLRGVR